MAGNAACESDLGQRNVQRGPTYAHDDEKAGKKAAQINDAGAAAVHEVIVSRRSAAQPVGDRGEDVCENDEEGQIVLEESGGEDDEEEADGENLGVN